MSDNVFPTLGGLEFNIKRTELWGGTTIQESISGKRTSINTWSSPRYSWELSFAVLPTVADMINSPSLQADFQNLFGFFNSVGGRFDTFLYTDTNDNSISSQALGVGDGTTTSFQLVSAFGGYVQPIFAPNVVSNVSIGGVTQGSSTYTVNAWGTAPAGTINFVTAPGSSAPTVTASFSYYFPVRCDDDSLTFNMFMKNLYECKSFKFSSEK